MPRVLSALLGASCLRGLFGRGQGISQVADILHPAPSLHRLSFAGGDPQYNGDAIIIKTLTDEPKKKGRLMRGNDLRGARGGRATVPVRRERGRSRHAACCVRRGPVRRCAFAVSIVDEDGAGSAPGPYGGRRGAPCDARSREKNVYSAWSITRSELNRNP